MAQAVAACPSIISLCAVRVTLLNDDGTVVDADNNSYVTDKVIDLGFTPEVSTGDDREQKNGCGCIIAAVKDPDVLKRFNFTLNEAAFEPGLWAMMLGHEQGYDDSDSPVPIGINFDINTLACGVGQRKVALEGWAKAWETDQQDALRPWVHLVWPATKWQLADNTVGADFANPSLTGFSEGNSLWDIGPYGDEPMLDIDGDPLPVTHFGMWQTVDTPPTAQCGPETVEVVT